MKTTGGSKAKGTKKSATSAKPSKAGTAAKLRDLDAQKDPRGGKREETSKRG